MTRMVIRSFRLFSSRGKCAVRYDSWLCAFRISSWAAVTLRPDGGEQGAASGLTPAGSWPSVLLLLRRPVLCEPAKWVRLDVKRLGQLRVGLLCRQKPLDQPIDNGIAQPVAQLGLADIQPLVERTVGVGLRPASGPLVRALHHSRTDSAVRLTFTLRTAPNSMTAMWALSWCVVKTTASCPSSAPSQTRTAAPGAKVGPTTGKLLRAVSVALRATMRLSATMPGLGPLMSSFWTPSVRQIGVHGSRSASKRVNR